MVYFIILDDMIKISGNRDCVCLSFCLFYFKFFQIDEI